MEGRQVKVKKNLLTVLWLGAICSSVLWAQDRLDLTENHLRDRSLPAGPAQEALPKDAILHVQVNDLLGFMEGIEDIVVAAVPQQLLPPDQQQLLQQEHPLLTVLGWESPLNEPLSQESLSRTFGLNPRGAVGVTLYPGDPRRQFVLSLPMGEPGALAMLLSEAFYPTEIEEIDLGGGNTTLRLVPGKIQEVSELFLVASPDILFVCGDRSLVSALYNTPSAQRMARDPFLSRTIPLHDTQQFRAVLNPALAKPLAMQLQGLWPMAQGLIHYQRMEIISQLPPEARMQIEQQLSSQLGISSLDQFADYAEAIVVATAGQMVDCLANNLIAFEGLALTANVQGEFPEMNLQVFSSNFKESQSEAAIPLGEIRKAMAWLGPDFQSFEVTGQLPAVKDLPMLNAWSERVMQEFEKRQLQSVAFDGLSRLLRERTAVQSLGNESPWILTTYAPLSPAPPLEEAESLRDYLTFLELPVYRPIHLVPGQDQGFLKRALRNKTRALNRNRDLTLDFVQELRPSRQLFDEVNRFSSAELGEGVTRYVAEKAYITRGGIFGSDQHELINRRIYSAKVLGDYLVYHRGARPPEWLMGYQGGNQPDLVPALDSLLDRVPDGANYVAVHRVLVGLPSWVNWLAALENKVDSDMENYLAEAQQLVDQAADLEQAQSEIRRLQMPELVVSVHLNPEDNTVYALLPGNLIFPRPKVTPLLQSLIQDYAQKANQVGGSLVYTRVHEESWELGIAQSTEALTTLISSVGNTLASTYLSSPEQQQKLATALWMPRDRDALVFDEVIARNPAWAFLPQPAKKRPAAATQPIPSRSQEATAQLLDLSDYYNGALTETWQSGGLANNSLSALPQGVQQFGEVQFDVRGVVQLSGQNALAELEVKFPEEVTAIEVDQKCNRVHFLHSTGWPSEPGSRIGSYVVHYQDGQSRTIPVVYEQDVRDWWQPATAPDSDLVAVWSGDNTAVTDDRQVSLYQTTWTNPLPEVAIESIDYVSAMGSSAPFLVAITLE